MNQISSASRAMDIQYAPPTMPLQQTADYRRPCARRPPTYPKTMVQAVPIGRFSVWFVASLAPPKFKDINTIALKLTNLGGNFCKITSWYVNTP